MDWRIIAAALLMAQFNLECEASGPQWLHNQASDAAEYCQTNQHLVTNSDQNLIKQAFESNPDTPIWLGYYNPGAWFTIDGEAVTWGNWHHFHINDESDHGCLTFKKEDNNKWDSSECKKDRYALCQKDNITDMQPDNVIVNGYQYWIEDGGTPVFEKCRSNGGRLAVFTDKYTWERVINSGLIASVPDNKEILLGITKSHWGSFSDQQSGLSYWKDGEPKAAHDCVVMTDGDWETEDCNEEHKVICPNMTENCKICNVSDNRCIWMTTSEHKGNMMGACTYSKHVDNMEDGNVWIGAKQHIWYTAHGERLSRLEWSGGEPNEHDNHCATIDQNGHLSDEICELPCDDDNSDNCHCYYDYYHAVCQSLTGKTRYWLTTGKKSRTIYDAHKACERSNGTLAIPGHGLSSFLSNNNGTGRWWVGITDEPKFWYNVHNERVDWFFIGNSGQQCMKALGPANDITMWVTPCVLPGDSPVTEFKAVCVNTVVNEVTTKDTPPTTTRDTDTLPMTTGNTGISNSGTDTRNTTTSDKYTSPTPTRNTDTPPTTSSSTNSKPRVTNDSTPPATTSDKGTLPTTASNTDTITSGTDATSSGADTQPTITSDTQTPSATTSNTDTSPTTASNTDTITSGTDATSSGADTHTTITSDTQTPSATTSNTDTSPTTASNTDTITSGTDATSSGADTQPTISNDTQTPSATTSNTDTSPTTPSNTDTPTSGTNTPRKTASDTDTSPATTSYTDTPPITTGDIETTSRYTDTTARDTDTQPTANSDTDTQHTTTSNTDTQPTANSNTVTPPTTTSDTHKPPIIPTATDSVDTTTTSVNTATTTAGVDTTITTTADVETALTTTADIGRSPTTTAGVEKTPTTIDRTNTTTRDVHTTTTTTDEGVITADGVDTSPTTVDGANTKTTTIGRTDTTATHNGVDTSTGGEDTAPTTTGGVDTAPTTTGGVDTTPTTTDGTDSKTTTTDTSNNSTFKKSSKQFKALCGCNCKKGSRTNEPKTVQEKIISLQKDLNVQKEYLSSTIRRRKSAPDSRVSSLIIGTTSAITLICTIGVLFVADILTMANQVYSNFCDARKKDGEIEIK